MLQKQRERKEREKKENQQEQKKKHISKWENWYIKKKIWDAMWTQQTITSLKKEGKPINHSEGMA